MAEDDKEIYAPGELRRVRERLNVSDKSEAKRMAKKLGGEIGYERTLDEENKQAENPLSRSTPKHRIELALNENEVEKALKEESFKAKDLPPEDNPDITIKTSYWDRVRLDKLAGESQFDIKSPTQVLHSMLSLFTVPPDMVSGSFIKHRIPEYYKKIENLVLSTRSLFPRNNLLRNDRIKKSAPLVYAILNTIRYWDIERISSEITKIQGNAKHTTTGDFVHILRAVYKPLFILEYLDLESHIRAAYKVLYKALQVENHEEANKQQETIRTALSSFIGVRHEVSYLLYPLLLKRVSATYVPYESFFMDRKNRIGAFLGVRDRDRIRPSLITIPNSFETPHTIEAAAEEPARDANDENNAKNEKDEAKEHEQQQQHEQEQREKEEQRRAAQDTEKSAMGRGIKTLEMLFPKAGWERLSSFPDLYPYFAEVFDLKRKGVVNIAPTDPMQQVYILMRILEELFFGFRNISFKQTMDLGGNQKDSGSLFDTINNWHRYLEVSFTNEYLPRLTEYVSILEGPREDRNSMYTKKIITELCWYKRGCFLPFYRFDSLVPVSFPKGQITSIYAKIRSLRSQFSILASNIEYANRAGGAGSHAPCDGMNNPWDHYIFEVPNPVSKRLNALLAPKARNNAALVYFGLAVVVVLDNLLNNQTSWAYTADASPLFRSVNGGGQVPLTGVDEHLDADAIFREALKQRQKQK